VDEIWPYYLPVDPNLADMEQYFNGPMMIGEYAFIAPGPLTPNLHPGIYYVSANQQQRADDYANFVAPLYEDAPWVVGDDWFEYVDEPVNGRPGDNEDDNFGLVNVEDQPYTDVVDGWSRPVPSATRGPRAPAGRSVRRPSPSRPLRSRSSMSRSRRPPRAPPTPPPSTPAGDALPTPSRSRPARFPAGSSWTRRPASSAAPRPGPGPRRSRWRWRMPERRDPSSRPSPSVWARARRWL